MHSPAYIHLTWVQPTKSHSPNIIVTCRQSRARAQSPLRQPETRRPQSVAGQLPPETHRHSHTETHPIPRERIHAIAPDGVVSVGSTAHPCGRPRTTKHCNSNCCFTQAHANTSQRIWTLDARHMLITWNQHNTQSSCNHQHDRRNLPTRAHGHTPTHTI